MGIHDLGCCAGGLQGGPRLRNSEVGNSGAPDNYPVAQTRRWGEVSWPESSWGSRGCGGRRTTGWVRVGTLRSVVDQSDGKPWNKQLICSDIDNMIPTVPTLGGEN